MKRNEKQLARLLVNLLDGSTKPQVESAAGELVTLLARQNEVHRVKGVIDAIEDAWREQYGAATVKIQTAYPLTSSLRKNLRSSLREQKSRNRFAPRLSVGRDCASTRRSSTVPLRDIWLNSKRYSPNKVAPGFSRVAQAKAWGY